MKRLRLLAGLVGRQAEPQGTIAGAGTRQEIPAPWRLFWGADGTFWNGAAVRDGPWKLVIDRPAGTPGLPLLFNLDDDLGVCAAGRFSTRSTTTCSGQ